MSTLATNAITDASGGNTATINGQTPTESNMAGRNRIINGDMRIDQRNAGASVTPNNSFTLDRWLFTNTQTSKVNIQQSSVAPSGFSNSLLVTSTSAYSVSAGDTFLITQIIEGFNIADLAWGSADAKPITISFWVRSSITGTTGGALMNSADNRNYVFSYTINLANTWEYKTVTIAGDTSGTWLTGNNRGISVRFGLGSGSTFSGAVGTWSSSNYVQPTGSVSVVGTNGATFYITGVQLEAGSVATPFERRQYGQELALCQRYYYKIYPALENRNFFHTLSVNTTSCRGVVQFPETLRTPPAALEQSGAATDYSILRGGAGTVTVCSSVPTFQSTTVDSATTIFTVASGLVSSSMGIAQTAAGTTAGYLAWSAEL
jgi:hypothetical protein